MYLCTICLADIKMPLPFGLQLLRLSVKSKQGTYANILFGFDSEIGKAEYNQLTFTEER